jgi:hypothetical protein
MSATKSVCASSEEGSDPQSEEEWQFQICTKYAYLRSIEYIIRYQYRTVCRPTSWRVSRVACDIANGSPPSSPAHVAPAFARSPAQPRGFMPVANRSVIALRGRHDTPGGVQRPHFARHDDDGASSSTLVPIALRQIAVPEERARCARIARAIARAFEPNVTLNSQPQPQPQDPQDPSDPKELIWVLILAPPSNMSTAMVGRELRASYLQVVEALKLCILSARAVAPSLHPHLLYMHNAHDALTAWMARHGVVVHLWPQLTFASSLAQRSAGDGLMANGYSHSVWAKLELPVLMKRVREAGQLPPSVHPELLLTTDTDVLFARDINVAALPAHIRFLAGANDQAGSGINGGVLVLNTTSMLERLPALIAYGRRRQWAFGLNEQTMFNKLWVPSLYGFMPRLLLHSHASCSTCCCPRPMPRPLARN